MGLKKRHQLRLPTWRQLIAVTALGSYLAVAGGIPLPAPTISGNTANHNTASRDSRPFPCQQHRCGCRTAEQCWQHCCCFSPAERRAWARAHGVEAEAAAAELMGADESSSATPSNSSLAAHRTAPNHAGGCCTAQDHGKPAGCCDHQHEHQHDQAQNCGHDHRHDCGACDAEPADAAGGVIGFHALGCRGISTFWVSCGAVAPLPPPAPAVDRPALSGTVAVVSVAAHSAVAETPDPPPKLAG